MRRWSVAERIQEWEVGDNNAHRFEGRYPQQRLGVRVAEENRATDDFSPYDSIEEFRG